MSILLYLFSFLDFGTRIIVPKFRLCKGSSPLWKYENNAIRSSLVKLWWKAIMAGSCIMVHLKDCISNFLLYKLGDKKFIFLGCNLRNVIPVLLIQHQIVAMGWTQKLFIISSDVFFEFNVTVNQPFLLFETKISCFLGFTICYQIEVLCICVPFQYYFYIDSMEPFYFFISYKIYANLSFKTCLRSTSV